MDWGDCVFVVYFYKEYFNRVQDGGVEGCALPLARALESQLTDEQSSTGRHWNSPKRYPTSKDKGEAAMRW